MGKNTKKNDGNRTVCLKNGPCGKTDKHGCCKRCGKQRKP